MWLNVACLGQDPVDGALPSEVGPRLRDALFTLQSWVRAWVRRPDAAVALTVNTTHAIDLALLNAARPPRQIVTTSMAHPTVRHSADGMAAFFSRMTGQPVRRATIPFEPADAQTPQAAVEHLMTRMTQAGDLYDSVVVIEHVSYLHGIRLPIEAICRRLREAGVVGVVVDGAQATGLIRPAATLPAAYAGCFHKYVGAAPGTAFLAVPAGSPPFPFHACVASQTGPDGMLPTLPNDIWESSAAITTRAAPPDDADVRLAHAHACTEALDHGLRPFVTTLNWNDPEVRSHIHAIDVSDPAAARTLRDALAGQDIRVGCDDRWLRVSWAASADAADIGRAALAISRSLREHGIAPTVR